MAKQTLSFFSQKSPIGRSISPPAGAGAHFDPRPVPAPRALRLGMQALGILSPRLAASAARQLFFHPLQAKMKPEQAARLEGGTPFALTIRDLDVQGASYGDGPAVFLAHGWGGHSGHMSSFIAPLVGAGYRVVVADMPAHGRSSGRLTSLIHFSDTLAAMAERFGDPHAVIAHSFGAAGATVAVASGLKAQRLAFVAPPSTYRTFWQRFQIGVGVSDPVFQRMVRRAELELGTRFAELHPEHIATNRHEPLLIVHDELDREIDVGEGQSLALAWPGAQLVTTRSLGHIRILADAGVVSRICAFVDTAHQARRTSPMPSTDLLAPEAY